MLHAGLRRKMHEEVGLHSERVGATSSGTGLCQARRAGLPVVKYT